MSYDEKRSGERIRQLRIHSGYTQETLAEKLNIDRSFLSYVESGKKGCSVDILVQLAATFGVSIDYIVLGSHSRFVNPADTAQMREEIETLICHLESFGKFLSRE